MNALGQPIDGKGPVAAEEYKSIEGTTPNVVERQPVKEPLQTGIKAIDAMIPIGRVSGTYYWRQADRQDCNSCGYYN